MTPKHIGVYAGSEALYREGLGRSLDLLRDHGINTLILGGGFRASSHVEEMNPFRRSAPQPEIIPEVRKSCEERDLSLWLVVNVSYAECIQRPTDYPELAVRDVFGNFIEPDQRFGFKWSASCCPSNPAIRRYFTALFEDLATRYDLDGITLTHLRFSPPSHSFMNLFSCFCPFCIEKAREFGYDAEKARKQLIGALEELRKLDVWKVRELSNEGATILDAVQLLGIGEEALKWFEFKARVVAENLAEFHDAAKNQRSHMFFSCDNYPPSFALLVGHRYRELEKIGDFLSPLLNHPTIFQTLIFAETCKTLMEWNRDLEEPQLLRFLYGLTGYGDLGLPDSLPRLVGLQKRGDAFETEAPLPRLIHREAVKAKVLASGSKPLFMVLEAHSSLSHKSIVDRIDAVKRVGVDGLFFTSFDGDSASLKAIEDGFEA